MAAYRRGLLSIILRAQQHQRMLSASASSSGFLQRACGSRLDSDFSSSSSSTSSYSYYFLLPSSSSTSFVNGTYTSETWCERGEGWSGRLSWRHLVERSVHTTVSRADDGEEIDGGSRNGGVSSGAVASGDGVAVVERDGARAKIANEEAREFVQQAHVAALKRVLREDARDTISYQEFLQLCRTVGMAPSDEDAAVMAHVFNQSGIVFTFRDRVHLHPEKVSGDSLVLSNRRIAMVREICVDFRFGCLLGYAGPCFLPFVWAIRCHVIFFFFSVRQGLVSFCCFCN